MADTQRKRVLFVCVENSARSQIAEALARLHGGQRVEAFSAGSRPSGSINPKVVEVMRELGYDLTTHHSKGLADLPPGPYDAAITMGCGDACPNVGAHIREDWELPNPKQFSMDQMREVRAVIEEKVKGLLERLG